MTTTITHKVVLAENLRTGNWDIHAEGCTDIKRKRDYNLYGGRVNAYSLDAADIRECVDSVYGPLSGSFYLEAGLDENDPEAWSEFADNFHLAPCIRHLPRDAR